MLPHLANFCNPCKFEGLIATQRSPFATCKILANFGVADLQTKWREADLQTLQTRSRSHPRACERRPAAAAAVWLRDEGRPGV